jgi:hypothetical protein
VDRAKGKSAKAPFVSYVPRVRNLVRNFVLVLPTSLATELPAARAKATSGKLCSKGSHRVVSKQCSDPERLPRSGLEVLSGDFGRAGARPYRGY